MEKTVLFQKPTWKRKASKITIGKKYESSSHTSCGIKAPQATPDNASLPLSSSWGKRKDYDWGYGGIFMWSLLCAAEANKGSIVVGNSRFEMRTRRVGDFGTEVERQMIYVSPSWPTYYIMKKFIEGVWIPQGTWILYSQDNQIFVLNLLSKENCDYIIDGGPWFMDGNYLVMKWWSLGVICEDSSWTCDPLTNYYLWNPTQDNLLYIAI